MTPAMWFIAATMVAETGAALCYALEADWRRTVIWLCYGIATLMITL